MCRFVVMTNRHVMILKANVVVTFSNYGGATWKENLRTPRLPGMFTDAPR